MGELCSTWGTLQGPCKIIMLSEQSASYPLLCAEAPRAHLCFLDVFWGDDSNSENQNKFLYEVTPAPGVDPNNCPMAVNGAADARDTLIRSCRLDSNLENLGSHISLNDPYDGANRRRRRLLTGNESG